MAQGLLGSNLAGHDVPPVFAFSAEISVLHRVREIPGLEKVFPRLADFRVPQVAERVLSQAALLSPPLHMQAEALPGIQ